MTENLHFPKNWVNITIGELTKVIGGGTPKSSIEEYYHGNIPWLTPADLSGYSKMYISEGRRNISELGLQKSSARVLPEDSVLFSSRAPIGYVAVANNPITTNQGFKNLLPNKCYISAFAYYYLKSIRWLAEQNASGTTFLELSGKKMSELPFPLAPLPEQQRIADRLDAVFVQLDAMKAQLAGFPDLLKEFRQSVLHQAVTGKLTEERGFDSFENFDVEIITGPFGSALHRSDYVNGGIPVINPSHIIKGEIKPNPNIAIEQKKAQELSRWYLKKNDIVLGRRGEMGRAALYDDEMEPMICGTGSLLLRVSVKVSPVYLVYFLQSPFCVQYLNSNSIGSTMVNLNQKILKKLPFPNLSIEEQIASVEKVKKLLNLADRLEAQYTSLQSKLTHLPQQILAKAFRGELVPQDPNDEPASVLLKRIKAEKEKMEVKSKSGKKKGRRK